MTRHYLFLRLTYNRQYLLRLWTISQCRCNASSRPNGLGSLTVNTERMMLAVLAIVQWCNANGYKVNGR